MNRRQVIVALDAGTSMLKAVAFDIKGEPVAIESRVNNYREAPGGTAEQDMAQTWTDAAATIAALVARLDHAEIVGLAVTGQGDGTWLIDAGANPPAPLFSGSMAAPGASSNAFAQAVPAARCSSRPAPVLPPATSQARSSISPKRMLLH